MLMQCQLEEIISDLRHKLVTDCVGGMIRGGSRKEAIAKSDKYETDAVNAINTYLYKQTLELIKNNVAYPELKSMIDADKLRQAAAERWGQE
jgi:hypothetical protein